MAGLSPHSPPPLPTPTTPTPPPPHLSSPDSPSTSPSKPPMDSHPAPPQPPLNDNQNPPIVDGIDEITHVVPINEQKNGVNHDNMLINDYHPSSTSIINNIDRSQTTTTVTDVDETDIENNTNSYDNYDQDDDGGDGPNNDNNNNAETDNSTDQQLEQDEQNLVQDSASQPVRPGDLAAFAELFTRFHTRVEKASAGRKYRPLRDAWDAAADEISRFSDRIYLPGVSDLVIEALRLGCESGKTVIVDACLDCIHRLFEYGHIGNDSQDNTSLPSSTTTSSQINLDCRPGALNELVSIVCACLEVKDEEVYLRMVQTLLTAATLTKSGLHQSTLLAAVRTIYNIFLNARMPGTRTTAKVSLTQVLNLTFSRMEAEAAEEVSSIAQFAAPLQSSNTHNTVSHVDEIDDDNEITKRTSTASVSITARVVSSDKQQQQGFDASDPSNALIDEDNNRFTSVLQRDAYLLFRALCKLSGKEYIDTNAPDAVGIRSKVLSLELIRILINNSGPVFRSGDRFIYALRQYLSRSLLINCTWNSTEVMDISFDILETLLRKDTLRPLLKVEIGALFETVVFRFLESPTAGITRKRRVLGLLSRLSTDRQTMADLFLNYDCDLESPNIFERIVHVISAAAQDKTELNAMADPASMTSHSSSSSTSMQDSNIDIRVGALSSVVQVVRSLREWSQPLESEKDQYAGSFYNDKDNSHGDNSNDLKLLASSNANNATEINKKSPAAVSHVAEGKDGEDDDGEGNAGDAKPSLEISPLRIRTSGVGIISEGSDRDTTQFEKTLKVKRDTVEGVKLFNTKPKRGIEYLIKNGRLNESDPNDIAQFLHKADNLDAAMIGEYLGDSGTLNVNVMHAYTDIHDFTNMTFDGALRLHLGGFRLPGEAQKIDRIMEKFASRFCHCNPNVFANADAAYILAYSCIMLHTDAHNDTIKNKMSKEDFIKNNRGINDGGDLDPTFLGKLYERITTTEIRLSASKKDSTASGDGKSSASNGSTAIETMDPVQRARQFEKESELLLTQTKVLFAKKRRPSQDYTYYSANNVHHARLMFDTAWYPILAAISLNLEEVSSQETRIVPLCLDGFRHGIAISSTFSMTTAKNAFVSSLAKFTHLNSISEMRTKNVECVRMMLAIAANEGNNLGEQWVLIVRAVSILEQIRAIVSGNPDKYLLQKTPLVGIGVNISSNMDEESGKGQANSNSKTLSTTTTSNSPLSPFNSASVPVVSGDTFKRMSSRKSSLSSNGNSTTKVDNSQKIDAKAASLAKTIGEGEIDRIFTNSSNLSATGVSDFCSALCTVALEELAEAPAPRLFCLQKIVEMAYYNMDSRTRIQWAKIWDSMGEFFVSAMCHSNRDVAMYSVDALRQLASKFLEKDELSNFAFQRDFLKPFEKCYSRSNSVAIRELVLSCISQIVLARAANIKSGWRSVFAVLALAADDKVESLMNFGWQIVDSITRKYVGVLEDVYVDTVMGISAYTKTTISTPVSLAAIELLSGRCASSLLSWVDEHDEQRNGDGKEHLFSGDDDGHIGLWFPILTGLAAVMQDERNSVRLAANNGLFKVLSEHGGRFSPSMWTLVFRGVLSPIFDDVRHLAGCNDKNEAAMIAEWAATTGVTALQSFVDVFVLHLDMTRAILSELLGLIRSWIMQENESVAREGMSILARLIMRAGDIFSTQDWKRIIQAVTNTFSETMPHEIVGSKAASNSADDVVESRIIEENGNAREMYDSEDDLKGLTDEPRAAHEEKTEANGHDDLRERVQENASEGKIDFRVVRSKCVVQLLLIELVQEVVVSFYRKLETDNIVAMSECLEMSHRFAHKFNADVELRYSLWRTGFMNQVPNLLKQETNGLMAYLRIMFWLYLDEARGDVGAWSEERVMALCESVLRRYIHACEEAPSKSEERREVAALSPVVSFIVNSVMQMSERQFAKHLNELYSILLDLVDSCNDRDVRLTVTMLLRARVLPSTSKFQAKAQLPGVVSTKVLSVKVVADASVQTEQEICATVSKVGGVRSVEAIDERANCFQVVGSAPDEMVVMGAVSLPFVKAAFVEVANLHQLD